MYELPSGWLGSKAVGGVSGSSGSEGDLQWTSTRSWARELGPRKKYGTYADAGQVAVGSSDPDVLRKAGHNNRYKQIEI